MGRSGVIGRPIGQWRGVWGRASYSASEFKILACSDSKLIGIPELQINLKNGVHSQTESVIAVMKHNHCYSIQSMFAALQARSWPTRDCSYWRPIPPRERKVFTSVLKSRRRSTPSVPSCRLTSSFRWLSTLLANLRVGELVTRGEYVLGS